MTVSRRAHGLAYLAFSPANHAKFCSSDQTEIFLCLHWQIMLRKSFQLWRGILMRSSIFGWTLASQNPGCQAGEAISSGWAAAPSRFRGQNEGLDSSTWPLPWSPSQMPAGSRTPRGWGWAVHHMQRPARGIRVAESLSFTAVAFHDKTAVEDPSKAA